MLTVLETRKISNRCGFQFSTHLTDQIPPWLILWNLCLDFEVTPCYCHKVDWIVKWSLGVAICHYLNIMFVNEWMTKTLSDNPARCGWRRCLRDPTVERPWWQPDQQVVISWRWCRQQQQSHHMVTAGPLSSTRVYGLDSWGRGGDTSYFSSYFLGYFSLV